MSPHFLTRFTISSLVVCTALLGCAGANVPGTLSSVPVVVPKAQFSLQSSFIQWQDNPNFKYTVSVTTTGGAPPVVSEGWRNAARERMTAVRGLFKDNVASVLQTQLAAKGVPGGVKQTITIMPVNGFYSGAEVYIPFVPLYMTTIRA